MHWILNSPNVKRLYPSDKVAHCKYCRGEKRRERWCHGMFLIKTEAFRDTHGVLRDQHQMINSLIFTLPFSRGVIKDFLWWCALSSFLPSILHYLMLTEAFSYVNRPSQRPQGVLWGCLLQGPVCWLTCHSFLPVSIRGRLPLPHHTAQ